jgi:sulfide dehydrogenase cytochrome subunit
LSRADRAQALTGGDSSRNDAAADQNGGQEINMMTQRATGFLSLAAAGLFGLVLAAGARAAEISKLVDACTKCHERDGASRDPNMPIIGGYSQAYLVSSLTAYKKKTRTCPEIEYLHEDRQVKLTDMCRIAKTLSTTDIEKLAKYYSEQRFRRANQDFDPELAKKGQQIHERNCEKCHSESGSVASDDSGILAGQWTPYLRHQFFAFYSEKRKLADKMKPKFDKLDKTDMEALLNYYASFK